ncbi:MAG: hypothetical protein IJI27_05335 [Oscillospiraceae bacterium]|nr:hypothetical protein [Oscillospiraceae bacterium]
MIEVIVTIEDGRLTGVYTKPNERISVELVDYDDIAAEEASDEREQQLSELDQKIESGELVNCW